MEHSIERKVALTDLIERVLDRGVAIHADVIISLAGIPLVGINLRALVAGMETMTQYGVMHEWDREIRAEGVVPGLRSEGIDVQNNRDRPWNNQHGSSLP